MRRTDNKTRIRSAVLAVLVILAAAAVGILLWRLLRYDTETEYEERIGDARSDEYDWSGRYYDSATMTTLSIEKTQGDSYQATISYEEEDGAIVLWSFTCTYQSSAGIMPYRDAVRTNVVITREGDGSANAVSFDRRAVYEGGSGYLYLRENVIHWVDEEESFGDGMMFEKL